MNNTIVILENSDCVIGVCTDLENAYKLVDEYYGNYNVITKKDIRDSGIEYIWEISLDNEVTTITFMSFELNKL